MHIHTQVLLKVGEEWEEVEEKEPQDQEGLPLFFVS